MEPFAPIAPPDSIVLLARNKKVTINWFPDPLRYHSVHVYRSTSQNSEFERVNELPIMISKVKDEHGKERYPKEFFTDRKVSNQVTYSYYLTAVDFFGRESLPSRTLLATPKDITPPVPPEYVNGKVELLKVTLNWTNRDDTSAVGINVYRTTSVNKPLIRLNANALPPTATTYTDMLELPGYYYYYVGAFDSLGNEAKSIPTMIQSLDIYPPAKVLGATAVADTGLIKISWLPNHEPDLMGYRIYRTAGKNIDAHLTLVNAHPMADTLFIDTLPRITRSNFYYQVVAVDSVYNMGEPSQRVSARMPDVLPPVKPFIKQALPLQEGLVVHWLPNAEPDLMGYHIYRATADSLPQAEWQKLNANLLDASVTRFTDRFIEKDSLYFYTLVALDSAGNQSVHADFYPGQQRPGQTEEKHGKVKLSANYNRDEKTVTVNFNIKDTEGLDGVIVSRKSRTEGEFKRVSGFLKEDAYTDKTIEPANVYLYMLTLYFKDGQQVKSGTVQVAAE
ncbi:MAG: hypothetical protein HC896_14000 [Bacteroidales bacterium]|nr:hypothetical protein [Bacteroidales bacterium]